MALPHWQIFLAVAFGGLALTGLVIPELGYTFLGLAGLLGVRWGFGWLRIGIQSPIYRNRETANRKAQPGALENAKGIGDARPFGEIIEWLWEGIDASSPYFEFVVILVNPSVHGIQITGHTAPVRIDGEPCGLPPQFGSPAVPAQDSRNMSIRQPLFPEQAKGFRSDRTNGDAVHIGTNEFHLRYTSDDPSYPSADLLIGYKYAGAGGYHVVPGFSMKQ